VHTGTSATRRGECLRSFAQPTAVLVDNTAMDVEETARLIVLLAANGSQVKQRHRSRRLTR